MAKPQTNPSPSVKPAAEQRCYVGIRNPQTRESAHTTVYDLRPDQVVEAIRIGVDELRRRQADAA